MLSSLSLMGQSIVNTEKTLSSTTDPFTFSLEAAGNFNTGNLDILSVEGGSVLGYRIGDSWFRAITGIEVLYEDKEQVAEGYFGQLRYNHFLKKRAQGFLFLQLQSNRVLLLQHRQLAGGGFRFGLLTEKDGVGDTVLSPSDDYLDISIGGMYEDELLLSDMLPEEEVLLTQFFRINVSLLSRIAIKDNIVFVNTMYFQLNSSDMEDYRFLNDADLLIELSEKLMLDINVEYRHDSKPPSLLTASDLALNLGFVLSF
jgi:hypothetical protein